MLTVTPYNTLTDKHNIGCIAFHQLPLTAYHLFLLITFVVPETIPTLPYLKKMNNSEIVNDLSYKKMSIIIISAGLVILVIIIGFVFWTIRRKRR